MYNQIEKQLVKCHKCKEIQRRVNDLKETKRDGMVCNRCDKEGKSDEMERREYLEYNNIDPGMEDQQERDEQLKQKTIINAQNKINFVKQ